MIQLGTKYRILTARPLDSFQAPLVKAIPGAHTEPGVRWIFVVAHAGWCVAQLLNSWGMPFEVREVKPKGFRAPSSEAAAEELLRKSELRPGTWWGEGCGPGGRKYVDYQRRGVLQVVQTGSGALWWKPGCLAGDTLIRFTRQGRPLQLPLAVLYAMFKKLDGPFAALSMHAAVGLPLLAVNDIVAVVESGVKPVWRVETATGESLKASAEHVFILADGRERRLTDLRVGDQLLRQVREWPSTEVLNSILRPTAITAITPLPPEETYDITMASPRNTFVANDIVVHNSGKTAGAIAWAVAEPFNPLSPRAVLTVTKAAVRRQWAREIGFWTTLEPWISDPSARRKAEWRSPKDYLTWCFFKGQRPWFIVSWEELAELVYGEQAYTLEAVRAHEASLAKEAAASEHQRTVDAFSRIHGVGPNLADAIILHFGSLKTMQEYRAHRGVKRLFEEVVKIKGVGRVTATSIVQVVHLIQPDPPKAYLDGFLPSLKVDSVIFDEIHMASNRARTKNVVPESTELGESVEMVRLSKRNRVAAAEVVSRMARRRLGTTATPIPNRVKDLWGQMDLIEPWGLGGYWKFAIRFAAAFQSKNGWVDTGSSNLAELTCQLGLTDVNGNPYMDEDGRIVGERGDWAYVSQVPARVSHGQLPPLRREIRRLDPMLLASGDSSASKAWRQAKTSGDQTEAALQWASTKKRPIVVEEVVERVLGGEKVLVLSGRHDDVERTYAVIEGKLRAAWAQKLRAADRRDLAQWLEEREEVEQEDGTIKKGRHLHPVPACWFTHGGCPDGQRDDVTRAYMAYVPAKGRCVGDDEGHPFGSTEAMQIELARLGRGDLALAGMGAFLIATGHSVGTGIDLHDTDTLIKSMLPITPEQREQWEGRVTRQGQLRAVLILYLVAEGTIDEHQAMLLLDKLPAVAAVTGQTELQQVADDLEGIGDEEAALAELADMFRLGVLGSEDMEDDGD